MLQIVSKIKAIFINFYSHRNQIGINEYQDFSQYCNKLNSFFEINKHESPILKNIEITKVSKLSWVGAQFYNNKIYFIPNSENQILLYDILSKNYEKYGNLSFDNFKWTGGCQYNGNLYCFARSSNHLLEINMNSFAIKLINLNCNYSKEHHYGGVLANKGIIYQPPRNTDHILKIDLNNFRTEKIYLSPQFLKLRFRYCGSIMHPNGMIYFLPENGRVMCFNPTNNHISYIGKKINAMCFDAKVFADGNIYGFSAYSNGILKIDVINGKVEMIHEEVSAKAYGTKLGINGKLYSIPGDGNHFYEFDPIKDEVSVIGETLETNLNAKCECGCIDKNGNIYSVPAQGKYIYTLDFNNKAQISSELYNTIFTDNY